MLFIKEDRDIDTSTTENKIDKRKYIIPALTVLSDMIQIHNGSNAYQIENSSGVFFTHS